MAMAILTEEYQTLNAHAYNLVPDLPGLAAGRLAKI